MARRAGEAEGRSLTHPARPSTVPRVERNAELWALVFSGVLLQMLAFGIIVSSDDEGLTVAAWLASGLGGFLLLVGAVGFGVLLGLRAHDTPRR